MSVRRVITVLVAMVALGCLPPANLEPILKVTDTPFPHEYGLDSAAKAIERAANLLSWRTEILGPGEIVGSKRKGTTEHTAQVLIRFDSVSFSISYRNSALLDYNGTQIHKLYNRWVRELRDAILIELSASSRSS